MQERTANERAMSIESGWHRPVASITFKKPIEIVGASCARDIISSNLSILLSLVWTKSSNWKTELQWTSVEALNKKKYSLARNSHLDTLAAFYANLSTLMIVQNLKLSTCLFAGRSNRPRQRKIPRQLLWYSWRERKAIHCPSWMIII